MRKRLFQPDRHGLSWRRRRPGRQNAPCCAGCSGSTAAAAPPTPTAPPRGRCSFWWCPRPPPATASTIRWSRGPPLPRGGTGDFLGRLGGLRARRPAGCGGHPVRAAHVPRGGTPPSGGRHLVDRQRHRRPQPDQLRRNHERICFAGAAGLSGRCPRPVRPDAAGGGRRSCPGTGGLWPRGVTVLTRRENLLGGVSLRCRAEFLLRLCLPLPPGDDARAVRNAGRLLACRAGWPRKAPPTPCPPSAAACPRGRRFAPRTAVSRPPTPAAPPATPSACWRSTPKFTRRIPHEDPTQIHGALPERGVQ